MKERKYANALDNIFSDSRIHTVVLAQMTKRLFIPETSRILDHWYMAHCMARDPEVSGQEMIDFVRDTHYGNKI